MLFNCLSFHKILPPSKTSWHPTRLTASLFSVIRSKIQPVPPHVAMSLKVFDKKKHPYAIDDENVSINQNTFSWGKETSFEEKSSQINSGKCEKCRSAQLISCKNIRIFLEKLIMACCGEARSSRSRFLSRSFDIGN